MCTMKYLSKVLVLAFLFSDAAAFIGTKAGSIHAKALSKITWTPVRMSDMGDFPSDTSSMVEEEPESPPESEEDVTYREKLKSEIIALGATTNRGQIASEDEKDIVIDLVYQLESMNPSPKTNIAASYGTWELVYSDVELFRSSPFFMAVRDLFGDDDEKASQAFSLHRLATSTSEIGKVKQVLGPSTLVSEVDLKVGTIPSLPFAITGTVVSDAEVTANGDQSLQVTVGKTKVSNSNILKFLNLEDMGAAVPVKDVFERLRGSVPTVPLNTYYLDDTMRISRTQDEHFFVYIRR
mmetsp:Transcript_22332/g.36924  ORF Transcript_22332/g.36924 Transcript_22332/m.36924 type:complete len:295 (+) Transcript_22332:82-966(+)